MKPRLAFLHCRAQVLQNVREPSNIVPALLFPSMFFVFFGVPEARDGSSANLVLASYATYAFMGATFNQFTGGIVQGRVASWDEYLRTLPASYSHRMVGWSLAGVVVGLLAFSFVAATALLTTEVDAGLWQWFLLSVAVLYGSISMGLLASAFGFWLMPRTAMPISTLVYLSLTYAGGIWTSPAALPGWLQEVSPFLPTRLWAELAWAAIEARRWQVEHWAGLTAYAVLFGVLAIWGYRRQSQRRLS